MIRKFKSIVKFILDQITPNPDRFLADVDGVIHIGANAGQEREQYQQYGLIVAWIEPIPKVYQELVDNLEFYPNQRAFQYLITDQNDKEYEFNIANNNGASSSILPFKRHGEFWPDVAYTDTITLRSITLEAFLEKERIESSDYQALILDTQGSELLILRGSSAILTGFRFIKVEVPDFESYEGCCQLEEMAAFMNEVGFKEHSRLKFPQKGRGGAYYDIVYEIF